MFEHMVTTWMVLLVIFVVVEVLTAGLVSIWFCFGAAAAMLVASLQGDLALQIIVFLVVSVVLLIGTKPFVKKFLSGKVVRTNADAILEQKGIVTEEINNLKGMGAVKIGGIIWTARSAVSDTVIPVGTEVRVKEIQGVKAIVYPVSSSIEARNRG